MTLDMFAPTTPTRRDVHLDRAIAARLTIIDRWMDHEAATQALASIMAETPWNHVPVIIAGKPMMQPRLTASYGDTGLVYRYSGTTNTPLPWTPTLDMIRHLIADEVRQLPNFVLMNQYRDGNDSIGWHADDERDLVTGTPIVALSLGVTRRFLVKPKGGGASIGTDLDHGTLAIMGGRIQGHYLHSIAKEHGRGMRVSLTFRTVRR